MVLGVVGTFASGKDTVADYLRSKGFRHMSTADEIRSELTANHQSLDRDAMTAYAAARRAECGNAYFTEKAIAKIEGDTVVTAMRHPHEIRALQQLPNFFLLAVDAPIELRFARAQTRGRLGDGDTLADFRQREERELLGHLSSHQLGAVMALADATIVNDATVKHLQQQVDQALTRFGWPRD